MRSSRRLGLSLALVISFVAPSMGSDEIEAPPADLQWGVEVRALGGAMSGEDDIGRTRGGLESRISFEKYLTPAFRVFGEVGSGNESVVDEDGLHRLFAEYRFSTEHDIRAAAGWIRVPFGRWDSLTLTRALIKDRRFYDHSESPFQLRRESAGLAFHAAPGILTFDLAAIDRVTGGEAELTSGAGHDLAGRIGIRHRGLSLGASVMDSMSGASTLPDAGGVALSAANAWGFDAEWSHGFLTLGGEYAAVTIDGLTSTGYYVQAAYDLSALVRGLRIVSKYDVMQERTVFDSIDYRRITLGGRLTLRRNLDVEIEYDLDQSTESVDGFGGSHFMAGLAFKF